MDIYRTEDCQICIYILDLSSYLQTHVFNCLLDISSFTQLSNKHLKFNRTRFFACPRPSLSYTGTTVLLVVQAKTTGLILDISLSHPISNQSVSFVGSALKMYPKSKHFSLTLDLSPWYKSYCFVSLLTGLPTPTFALHSVISRTA